MAMNVKTISETCMSKCIILIPHEIGTNVYLRELAYAYERAGAVVVFGRDNFLYFDCHPDIVHIHWPEQLYSVASLERGTELDRVKDALKRLQYFKKKGTKTVLTMHNLMPHENGDSEAGRLICQGCFDEADLVVHHCERSLDLVKEEYVGAERKKNIVLHHGHYLVYPSEMTRQEARESLGLHDDDFVFLHFGIIRGYKGLQHVLSSLFRVKVKNKKLVVAGWPMNWQRPTRSIIERVRKWVWDKQGRLIWCLRKIQNDEVQRFLKACDAVVLGHTSGLNSGVAILGMTFGRVVVGPDLGCIGEVLRSGENVVYDPTDSEGLMKAMGQAALMDLHQAGERNRTVAIAWSWDTMARGILDMIMDT